MAYGNYAYMYSYRTINTYRNNTIYIVTKINARKYNTKY